MRCCAVKFVLCLLLFSSEGLELEIVENGETKPMPSVVQTKAGTTFSLVCKSEFCRNSCESLTWRRRRKGTRSSLETSPASGSNWLNFTDTILDDQGFYDCVDTEHKTGKVMYLMVRKPGFEKESIEINKNDLVLVRKKRDVYLFNRTNTYKPYDPNDNFDVDGWFRTVKELQDAVDRMNKEPTDLIKIATENKYDTNTFKTGYHPMASSNNAPKTGVIRGKGNADPRKSTNETTNTASIFWGIAGVVLVSIMIYAIVRCCSETSSSITNGENINRPPRIYTPNLENVSRPARIYTPNCYHTVCREYRARYPGLDCLYSTPRSPLTTMPANDTTLPSDPLLEVPMAPFLRQNGRDEPPTYIESTGNSAASSITNLNEVGQNGRGQDAVDDCALPPTYEEALYDIALGPPDPPSGNGGGGSSHDHGGGSTSHSGNAGGGGSSHDTGGGSTTCDYGGGDSGGGGGDSGGGGGDSGGAGDGGGGDGGD